MELNEVAFDTYPYPNYRSSTYGEVSIASVSQILTIFEAKPGQDIFLDLGNFNLLHIRFAFCC